MDVKDLFKLPFFLNITIVITFHHSAGNVAPFLLVNFCLSRDFLGQPKAHFKRVKRVINLNIWRKVDHYGSPVYFKNLIRAVPFIVPFFLWPIGLHIFQAYHNLVTFLKHGNFIAASIGVIFVALLRGFCQHP